MIEEDSRSLEELAKKAGEILSRYSIPITEYLSHEIENLVETINSKGHGLTTLVKIQRTVPRETSP